MNNKLLISVSLPILDISFDLEVPNIIKVGSLKNIILDYVRNNYNNDMNFGTFRLMALPGKLLLTAIYDEWNISFSRVVHVRR